MCQVSFAPQPREPNIRAPLNIAILTADPSNYSNRRMMEAGRAAGHNVYPLLSLEQILSVDDHEFEQSLSPRPDAVIPRIGVALTDYGHSLLMSLEDKNIPVMASAYGLVHSRNKFLGGQVLKSAGIAVPKTVTFADYGNIDKAIKLVGGYPFVLKRLKGTQGNAVFLINDVDKAHKKIGKYIRRRKAFLIQQYIKESQGTDLRCFVVGGKVVGAMKRVAAKGNFRANIHQGGKGLAATLSKAERDMAIEAAEVLDLQIAGVDILRSDNGPMVLEVNSSPGLQGIEKATGKDIAGEIIRYIEKMVHKSG